MKISRRGLLGAGATALGASAFGAREWGIVEPSRGKWAKNIIFCVSDGMAASVPTMVDHYRQLTEGKPGYWAWLMCQPGIVNGLQDTRSLSSVVTDSSAASSAWGSGRRIWNGQVNMFPDGTKLVPITHLMSAAGVKCGLVSTARITHATPAGFAVQGVQRDKEDEIAELYLGSGVDVLLGGGHRHFAADKRKDKADLYAKFKAAGFSVARTKAEMASAPAGKLLGAFTDSHITYTVDRLNNAKLDATVPTLAEMSKVAIDRLKGGSNGFLLQIEGGRVDHGNHANDLAGTFFDQIEFEEAVKVAMDFAIHDGETLVIVTADHATAGISLNGAGDEYFDSTAGLKSIQNMKASFEIVQPALGKAASSSVAKDVFKKHLGIELTNEEAMIIEEAGKEKWAFGGSEFFRSMSATLGMVIGNHTKVTYTSSNHTNDHVLVSAYGPGAELCAGLTPNTDFNKIILDTHGLRHDNPTMDLPTAIKHMEKAKAKPGGEEAVEHWLI